MVQPLASAALSSKPPTNSIERGALNSWVAGWASDAESGSTVALALQSLHALQGLPQGILAGRASEGLTSEEGNQDTDWEGVLHRQNASNDELCAENSRLQLEIHRLRAESTEERAADLAEEGKGEGLTTEDLEEELLVQIKQAVDAILSENSLGGVQSSLVESVMTAAQTAVKEDADSSLPLSSITPEEEMALLVGEKMALREKVERQQERIELLEDELRDLGSVPPSALSEALTSSVAWSLSGAGGVLSALLAPKDASVHKDAVRIGGEYEVISTRGAIVRYGDSLRSEIVAELPAGSRVRVLAVSTRYPRRVEIIFMPPEADKQDVPGDPEAISQRKGVVGWISASAKDGRFLIRAVRSLAPSGSEGVEDQPASEDQNEDQASEVTLSAEELECLNDASNAAIERVEMLTAQLSEMAHELLQSFEMRSVLAQLQQYVKREEERGLALGESAAMAADERRHWQLESKQRFASQFSEEPTTLPDLDPGPEADEFPKVEEPCHTVAAKEPTACANLEAIDWDRLLSERETTAAALSAALQRLISLQREVDELQLERQAIEGREGELGGLRERLRRKLFRKPASKQQAQRQQAARAASASHALFSHRFKDLRRAVDELQVELHLAIEGERALRRSISARTSALRGMLHRAATAGLNLPQCGPLRVPVDPEAERVALASAVEEQLRWNLRLRESINEPNSEVSQAAPLE